MRVLEVFREPIAHGGQEMFLINMYRHMNHDNIQLDFLTPFTVDNPELKAEIESYGGNVYSYNNPFGTSDNVVFKQSVTDFLSKHSYDTVHIHSGSTYALMEGSKIARKSGARNVLVHSHCGGFANLKYHIIKTLSIPYLKKYPTQYLACSSLAARWKYPNSILNSGKVRLIKNAVDTERFSWNPDLRTSKREELGIQNELVVGHVGRFSLQKNHAFLIDVFFELLKKEPNAILLLIGVGELQEEIQQKVKDLNIEDHVRFLNLQSDIPAFLNAMDVFVLPSFFEGLPIAGVEAQATSLPVVTSTDVTNELPIRELASFLDLKDSPEHWADAVLEKARTNVRKDRKSEMKEAGYSIQEAAKAFEQFYLSLEQSA